MFVRLCKGYFDEIYMSSISEINQNVHKRTESGIQLSEWF